MDTFYITYQNKTDDKRSIPSDIDMGWLDNYKIAEKYLTDYVENIYRSSFNEISTQDNIFKEIIEQEIWHPFLITNDAGIYLKYKGVFTPRQFKFFCGYIDNYETLTTNEKALVDNGRGNRGAYENFLKLIEGEGKWAYEVTRFGKWTDENGRTQATEIGEYWKLENKYYINEKIKSELL
jgi:hypothetical protein